MMHQQSFWKFRKILLSLFSVFISSQVFSYSDKDCLNSSFETKISHKGTPFGLSKNIIEISKSKCSIVVKTEQFRFLKKNWEIDICRGPIHIKEGTSSVSVLKKTGNCANKKSKDGFCQQFFKISDAIQDFGLIFAKGEKEDLQADHGRVSCTFKMLNYYLSEDRVLSRVNSFKEQEKAVVELKLGPAVKVDAPIDTPVEGIKDIVIEDKKIEIKDNEGEF